MYVSEREGCDSTGDGTEKKPFKTALKVSAENTQSISSHVVSIQDKQPII